jgi:hypothetical protein
VEKELNRVIEEKGANPTDKQKDIVDDKNSAG